jgi:hypothetical protein
MTRKHTLAESIGVLLALLVFVMFSGCAARLGWALGDHVLRSGP